MKISKKKAIFILVIISASVLLLFVVNPKKRTMIAEKTLAENIKIGNIDIEKSNSVDRDGKEDNLVYTSSSNSETEAVLTEKILIVSHLEDGEWIVVTNRTMISSKQLFMDPDTEEASEYIRIARSSVRTKIPEDIKPVMEIQGEWVVVTFPWHPPKKLEYVPRENIRGPSYFAEIIIDIKTKAVLRANGG